VGVVTVVNQLEVSASQVLLGRCLCEFPKVVFVSILALLNRSIDEASYVAVLLILGGSDEVFARVVTIGNFISVLNLALGGCGVSPRSLLPSVLQSLWVSRRSVGLLLYHAVRS